MRQKQPLSQQKCPVYPYKYYLQSILNDEHKESLIKNFIVHQIKNYPEALDQLSEALESFPELIKYKKLLVLT